MGGISNDNIIKFVLGISGLGLSLASFTLSRVFTLEEYSHELSERIYGQEVRIQYIENLSRQTDETQRVRFEKIATIEAKLEALEEDLKELKERRNESK